MAKKKRQRRHKGNEKGEKDRLSDLPDCILLHILKYIDINYAIQTCVLSKRWKNLWKRLTSLTSRNCLKIRSYNRLLSHVLSCRDYSYSLTNVDVMVFRSTAQRQLKNVIKYAALHNVQQMTFVVNLQFTVIPNSFVPLIFLCHSLTFLEFSIGYSSFPLELPKSLMLPSVKTLHLKNVSFTANGNSCAEPFSPCTSLNTLVLADYTLRDDAQVLHLSNSNLSSLRLESVTNQRPIQPRTVLSVPNLTSFTIFDNILFTHHELSSTCNLLFLEEVSIFRRYTTDPSIIITWLHTFSNIKTLTLASCTLNLIQRELSNLGTKEIQPPCFDRLESLKIKLCPYRTISDDGVARVMDYLLQKSPVMRVSHVTRWKDIKNLEFCSYRRCFMED